MSDDDFLERLQNMSDDERAQVVDRLKEQKDKVESGLRRGDLKCPACGSQVTVHRKADLSWTSECRCGWEASGFGHAPVN